MSKRKASPRVLVVLSDLHCGSTVALCPPAFTTIEGEAVGLNKCQRFLWECWLDCNRRLEALLGGEPFALVLNGDLIEGIHHRTTQVISSDPADHVTAAEIVLRPLAARAVKVFVVAGTEVHVGSREHGLGRALGAVANPDTGRHSFDKLRLDFGGQRCHFAHHIGTSIRSYLAGTQLSVELAEEQTAAARAGRPVPMVIGRAHRHRHDEYRCAHGLCFTTPSWQLLTRHGHKVVSSQEDVVHFGLVVLDKRGLADDKLPRLEPILCQAPAATAVAV